MRLWVCSGTGLQQLAIHSNTTIDMIRDIESTLGLVVRIVLVMHCGLSTSGTRVNSFVGSDNVSLLLDFMAYILSYLNEV